MDNKPHNMPDFNSTKNWKEDYTQENGFYICLCVLCKEYFYGNKHRNVCKECDDNGIQDPDDFCYVQNKMENEGFHYCFEGYSNWDDIHDKQFHVLRENYKRSAKELEDYVDLKATEQQDRENEGEIK